MKIKTKIFSLTCLITFMLMSCSNNADTTITQRIMGAGDCIQCQRWSWNKGEASTTDYFETGYFSFKTEISGELTFYYRTTDGGGDGTELSVTINNKNYFYSDRNGPSSFQYVSLGNIKAGEIVVFTGCRYKVKDIKIEGQQGSIDNPENPQWDF